MFTFGKVIVLLPLIVLLAYLLFRWSKIEFRVVSRASVYAFVGAFAVLLFAPPLGVVGTILGTLITAVLATVILITVVELPPSMDSVHNFAWRDGWNNPWYARGTAAWKARGKPVPYARWARRFALMLVLVFVFFVHAFSGVTDSNQPAYNSANGGNTSITDMTTTQPTTPATAAPQATDTTTTPTTDDNSAPAQQYVDNKCSGPKQIPLKDKAVTKSFGPDNLKVCYNGKWQSWGAFSTLDPPKTVQLTGWVVEGSYGYGQVVDPSTGDSYIIQTSSFK